MKYTRSRPVWYGLSLIIIDGLFFGLTSPNQVPSIMLIVGFGLILLNVYWLLYNLQKIAGFYFPAIAKQKRLSVGLLVCVGFLLALQSIGQLSGRDVVLVPLATLVLYAYLSYGNKPTIANSN